MKGQFARRAMELGGFPVRSGVEHGTLPCHTVERDVTECDAPPLRPHLKSFPASPALWLSKTRLVQVMRKIDPDLAHMIESLAPAYLVKR